MFLAPAEFVPALIRAHLLSPRLVLLVHLGLGPPVTTGERLRLGGTTRTSPHSTSPVVEVAATATAANFSCRRGCPSSARPSPSSRRGDYSRRVLAVEGGRDNRHVGPSSVAGRPTGVAADAATLLCYYAMSDHPVVLERQIDSDNIVHVLSSWDASFLHPLSWREQKCFPATTEESYTHHSVVVVGAVREETAKLLGVLTTSLSAKECHTGRAPGRRHGCGDRAGTS